MRSIARKQTPTLSVAGLSLLALFGGLTVVACGSDEAVGSGSSGGSGAEGGDAGSAGAGAGGIAGAGGSAGSNGGAPAGRADPANFPETCDDSCETACARLDECGGADSAYPVDRETCVSLCGLARGGPVWDDISGNFRCCTSQASCGDVQNCGGYLTVPDPVNACKQLCTCLVGPSTAPSPPEGAVAPPGYAFSTDSVVVRQLTPAQPGSGVLPGAKPLFRGRYAAYQLPFPVSQEHLKRAGLEALPTFTDGAGRLAGGTAGLSVQVSGVLRLADVARVAESYGFAAPQKLKYGHNLYYLQGNDPWVALEARAALAALPGVSVEVDMVRQHEETYHPLDPLFPRQWHLENRGERDSVRGVDGRVAEAWDLNFGQQQVVIAVNDDGVAVNHKDLGFDILAPLNYPEDWESRLAIGAFGGHGTSVAGVAAANGDNGNGGSGVCPGCRILPNWFGEFGSSGGVTDKDIADGFTRIVDGGAWVINNSWGAAGGDPRYQVTQFGVVVIPQLVKAAFDYAETEGRDGKGTVILFAAGNSNQLMNDYGSYDSVLGVTAVDDQGLKSYYSNYGPKVDIAAPSNGGLNGITTTAAPDGYTNGFGGTSSACPFASGVAGLILSANPSLTAAEVRDILRASATKIDPVWGEWENGFSPYYGSGLVNAYVAVRMATGCTDPAECQAPSDACGNDCAGEQCAPCRTDANCAAGYRCQALPALGEQVCVAEVGSGACPTGTDQVGDYCIPQPSTCGVCEATERCNGRDDDCDGAIDEDADCQTQWCVQGGEGCGDTGQCAGITCATACSADAPCAENESCDVVKSRYGKTAQSERGCNADLSAGCPAGCQLLASSLPDAELQDFIDCMEDGAAACSTAQGCALKLPVTF
ncbi:MAG: S8 family serine peptidase [Polyangiaceae bacterium]